jgi:hypothetical protein
VLLLLIFFMGNQIIICYIKLIWGKVLNFVFAIWLSSLLLNVMFVYESTKLRVLKLFWKLSLLLNVVFAFWMSSLLLNVVFAFECRLCVLNVFFAFWMSSLLLNVVFAFDSHLCLWMLPLQIQYIQKIDISPYYQLGDSYDYG